jgi:hypothetical protein
MYLPLTQEVPPQGQAGESCGHPTQERLLQVRQQNTKWSWKLRGKDLLPKSLERVLPTLVRNFEAR